MAEAVYEIANRYNLVDLWRVLHPKGRQYTWSREKHTVASRLDYWWVSNRMLQKTINCKIAEAIQTDHRALIWQIKAPLEVIKGPGIWKLNDSFLNEQAFCNQVQAVIEVCENRPVNNAIDNWVRF